MPENPEPLAETRTAADTLATALVSFSKALKALSFYPAGHPRRELSCREAFRQLKGLTCEHELSLLVRRDGIAPAERPTELLTAPTMTSLARELLTRRIRQLHFLPTLSLADLRAFLALLAVEPASMSTAGSMDDLMAARSIVTICINELDLTKLMQNHPAPGESDTGEGEGAEAAADDTEQVLDSLANLLDESMAAMKDADRLSFHEIIERIGSEPDDQRFITLLLDLLNHVQPLLATQSYAEVVPALVVLTRLVVNPRLEASRRQPLGQALERCLPPAMAGYLADQLRTTAYLETTVVNLARIMPQTMVSPLVQQLDTSGEGALSRVLAQAITACGQPAVPSLLAMLRDKRWYVARNAVTLLGELGQRETVAEVRNLLQHKETKVRREVVRALLRIGGGEAESALLPGLDDADADVVRQTVQVFGVLKSRLAVPRLLAILGQRDLFLTRLAVKKDAILALGRIGDRQAVTPLLSLLATRRFLVSGRWLELRSAAATALGQLGDPAATPTLRHFADKRPPLGAACREALNLLSRDT
jgi:hypothetical protein